MKTDTVLLLGVVAYDPKVVTIWEGFKAYFARQGLLMDYVLYSNYERQVEALLDGHIHVAWNSPLAWVRAHRLAQARGKHVQALAMRDTDRDLTSVVVVRSDSPIQTIADLKGRSVAVGAADSPQATLLPLAHLHAHGLNPNSDIVVQYNNILVGKHGDHIGGERKAAEALAVGKTDAACLLEYNYHLFTSDGTLPTGTTRILTRTAPFDHCNFTVDATAPQALVDNFYTLLLEMSYDDPEVRPLCDLEGLKAWYAGRVEGYQALEAAVDDAHFYDQYGNISVSASGSHLTQNSFTTRAGQNLSVNAVCDGGDQGCGGGLLILILQTIKHLEHGDILEIRSTDVGVREDLPTWCRMTGNVLLAAQEGTQGNRYFVRKE